MVEMVTLPFFGEAWPRGRRSTQNKRGYVQLSVREDSGKPLSGKSRGYSPPWLGIAHFVEVVCLCFCLYFVFGY